MSDEPPADIRYCRECGTELEGSRQFCTECGTPQDTRAGQQQPGRPQAEGQQSGGQQQPGRPQAGGGSNRVGHRHSDLPGSRHRHRRRTTAIPW